MCILDSPVASSKSHGAGAGAGVTHHRLILDVLWIGVASGQAPNLINWLSLLSLSFKLDGPPQLSLKVLKCAEFCHTSRGEQCNFINT